MEPKDMTNTYLLELIRDRRFYLSDEVDELLRRLNDADALRKENEELAKALQLVWNRIEKGHDLAHHLYNWPDDEVQMMHKDEIRILSSRASRLAKESEDSK